MKPPMWGVALDHIDDICSLIVSFGRAHRHETFRDDMDYMPMVNECEGYVFTDYRVSRHHSVDVYREQWMKTNCVAIRGDKGQVAALLGKPCLPFDIKEETLRL